MQYVGQYGLAGLYVKMNARTVSQILTEFQPTVLSPIATGDVEGIRYALYENISKIPDSGSQNIADSTMGPEIE